jgi:hypothetical protein
METDQVVQKVKELRAAVVHHATEEEREMFLLAEDGSASDSRSLVSSWQRGRGNWRPPASGRPSARSRRRCARPLEQKTCCRWGREAMPVVCAYTKRASEPSEGGHTC